MPERVRLIAGRAVARRDYKRTSHPAMVDVNMQPADPGLKRASILGVAVEPIRKRCASGLTEGTPTRTSRKHASHVYERAPGATTRG
jgi:hypothetical protein